jgi:hypothetical protein
LLKDPFLPLSSYHEYIGRLNAPEVPVLQRPRRGNSPNFNQPDYVAVSKAFARDGWAAVRARPDLYFSSVARAAQLVLTPASDYPFLSRNRARIVFLESVL